jgi:hypothetical protein
MKKIFLLALLLAGLGLVMGGCSSSTDPAEIESNLEDFGQFTATDEASPDFGDADLAEVLADTEEEEYDDPVAESPVVINMNNLGHPDVFGFRMIWGNLPRDTNVTKFTDWSGSLTISRGAIVVTHLIKFEPGQDYLLPRYNDTGYYIPEELHWVSQTSWHMDGLATKLYIPPSVNEDTVTLTYESDQLSISFTIDQLEDLDTLIDVDYGNAVSFQAIRCELWADSPTRGHLAGRWGRDDNGQGIFYGRWMNSNGRLVGAIKGVWGIDDAGNQVFIGKWIDRSGKFRGFVKGLWYQDPLSDNVRASGRFRGMIFNAERLRIGYLHGHYTMRTDRPGGYFAGKWCVGECSDYH